MKALHSFILAMVAAGVLALSGCKPPPAANFTDIQYPWAVKRAEVGTTGIAYADVGSGEQTLVLIHGLGSYMPAWSRNVDALAREYRVIAIDLPGYGQSDKPKAPYSMTWFAKKLRGLLDELGVAQPVLVGHSMGGQIALTYALMFPEQTAGLVLSSPAGFETFEDGEAKWLANALTPAFTCAADDESIYARHAGNFHRMPKEAEFMVADRIAIKGDPTFPAYCEAVSRSVAGMLDEPVYDRLPSIEAPTLVLFGKSDDLIPNPFLHGGSTVKLAEKATKQLPNARLVILDRAGHFAQFEQADAWNSEVLGFLRRLPAPVVAPPAKPAAEAEAEVEATPTPAPTPTPTTTLPPVTAVDEIEDDEVVVE